MAAAQSMTLDELFEEFEFLGDWDDQCDFLIDLGLELPELPDEAKTEANRVHGCQSNVWLVAEVKPGDPPVIDFDANSDAIIVNGLIAVLTILFSGRTAQQILDTDVEAVFAKLGLERHLSSQRRNGLYGMVGRIREIARQAAA
jgi:cysteine desulfuration protein SufE